MKTTTRNNIFVVLALVVFGIVMYLPQPDGLTAPGQVALAVTAMAIILWITEAVPYTISASMIVVLLAVFMGLSPNPDGEGLIGTSNALGKAMGGFSTPSLAIVAGGLFIAVGMEVTGLHRRLALIILDKIGTQPRRLVVGITIVAIVLALFVPSATARAGALVPIVLGIISALGAERESKLSAMLLVTTIQIISIWNIGIMTAAAQNPLSLSFITAQFGLELSWMDWFVTALPFAVVMSLVLIWLIPIIFDVDESDYKSDPHALKDELRALGPMSLAEKKLMVYVLILLGLWVSQGYLHSIDSTTVTLLMFVLMIMPVTGFMTWKEVEKGTNWGTLLVFAIGISLGQVLLDTGAASWLTENTLGQLGIQAMSPLAITAILGAVNILVHLGFASATSLSSVFIPIVVSLLALADNPAYNPAGLAIIQAFFISFGFILPINAPQNMLAFGTGGYKAKDLIKAGIPITIIGYVLILILTATYWSWIGVY